MIIIIFYKKWIDRLKANLYLYFIIGYEWRSGVDLKRTAISIFLNSLRGIHPSNLIKENISLEDSQLKVQDEFFIIPKKIHVFGSGKASIEMAKAIEKVFDGRIEDGLVVCNYVEKLNKICVMQGSHPIPDEKSLTAGEFLLDKISRLKEEDFFIYLLSGGSSALIEKLIPPISLNDLRELTNLLLKHSVPIEEINVIRKHISRIKGGRLGHSTRAKGIVLVISDVIGDDLFTIGSAPLYYDKSTYMDAFSILKRYNLWEKIPKSVRLVIEKGIKGEIPETPKEENPNIKHFIIGSNIIALEYAKKEALEKGFKTYIMTSQLKGEAREVAKSIVAIGKEIKKSFNPFKPPVCLLFGGETTVTVKGKGKGGRNQEMCLSALKEIKNEKGIVFLSCGTDGIDGNSDAAGAVVDYKSYKKSRILKMSIDEYLNDNNSYNFFYRTGDLIFTGNTGTNVMDVTILLVENNTEG